MKLKQGEALSPPLGLGWRLNKSQTFLRSERELSTWCLLKSVESAQNFIIQMLNHKMKDKQHVDIYLSNLVNLRKKLQTTIFAVQWKLIQHCKANYIPLKKSSFRNLMSCRVSLCKKGRFKIPFCFLSCPPIVVLIIFLPAFTFRVSPSFLPTALHLFFFFFLLSLEACRI